MSNIDEPRDNGRIARTVPNTATRYYDVLISGAGVAGCATALKLAGNRSVLLVDREVVVANGIGESLHPDGRRLLAELGLLGSMINQDHLPYHANRSVWGSDRVAEMDFLRHPDGPGWHLDRRRFNHWLRDEAVGHGARLLVGTRAVGATRDGGLWQVQLSRPSEDGFGISAAIMVDAGGRRSPLARNFGMRRKQTLRDRLACGWVHVKGAGDYGAGVAIIEATSDGWWYTAPLPGDRRVLAFHTDRDLPAASAAASSSELATLARTTTLEICRTLGGRSEPRIVDAGFTDARGSYLEQPIGNGWLAVGDAALATDPISARGLLLAFHTGIAAANAIERALSGMPNAFDPYAATIAELFSQYEKLWLYAYGQERRFVGSAFWQRRLAVVRDRLFGDLARPLSGRDGAR